MHFVGGNRLTLLCNGAAYFPALAEAIDAAAEEVFIESYIYADDETGSLITDALARAAARGVRVRLLVDGFGARHFPQRFRDILDSAGAALLVFRPRLSLIPRRNRMRRMHRKLAAIDGRVAFVGGINVTDDYESPLEDPRTTPPRYDYAVRIEGPLAHVVRGAAARLWQRVRWAQRGRRTRLEPPPARPPLAGEQRAALVIRDSLRHRGDIERAYLQLIGAARVEIVIACAYFFPGRQFRKALIAAARRGVRVRLVLQGKIEYPFLHYASRGLYDAMLDAGIEIFDYHAALLHAKAAVFDRRIASVGSSNIDPLSLLLAQEANVFVEDPRFALELHQSIEGAVRFGALPVRPRLWKRQPWLTRLRIAVTFALARFLISFYGFERYH
ncbi:MAG TPA: cardiolipin synthase ClsB [Burkholderiales bacterium]|nr:cardiolipin synthase ClsB [Burkholderiales bacterium]